MRIVISAFTLIGFFENLCAQSTVMQLDLDYGQYDIGYQDTIIFDYDNTYSYQIYQDARPFFVGIWFPTVNNSLKGKLSFKEYFQFECEIDLKIVADSLQSMQKRGFLEAAVLHNLDTWGEEPFDSLKQQLFSNLWNMDLICVSSFNHPQRKFPTVIYRHGAGGFNSENSVLFEYLASHGYVVISSNYEWPKVEQINEDQVEDQHIDRTHLIRSEVGYIKLISNFASSLSLVDTSRMNFVGHSFGSQVGLFVDQSNRHYFKTFVLLESTLEKFPLRIIKRYWPELDTMFINHREDFNTDTYIITGRTSELKENGFLISEFPSFEVFKLLDQKHYTLINSLAPMNHNSYISAGVFRSLFQEKYVQKDSSTLKSQFENYLEVNRLVLDILEGEAIDENYFRKE